jgi:hypothetical protein
MAFFARAMSSDQEQRDSSKQTAYRSTPGSGAAPRSLVFLPQFRVYIAPIMVTLAMYVAHGALGPQLAYRTYHRHLRCDSQVNQGRVVYSTCEGAPQPMDCGDAASFVRRAYSPGPFVRNLTITGRGHKAQTSAPPPISSADADALLRQCLPTTVPPNPSSYQSSESRSATIDVHGDDYFISSIILSFAFLLGVAFLPNRVVRVRVDPKTRMVKVKDFALWRRPRTLTCLLSEIEDITVHDSRLAFTRREGSPLPLVTTDRRPVELQRRTVKRLGAWLADARTWAEA